MQPTINMLVVDDEPRNLDALEAILAHPSYRLLRATNADMALKLLLEHDVAAIVLDIKMPGVSGFELAQLIKGTKKFRQIPILFLTAYLVEDKDILTGYGAGAVDYLTKPVNPAILRHKVSVFADLFRKTRALAELNETLETRVQERTAALAKSEAALRETNDQKDRFIATLAHELRNPLAPLRTGLDLLMRNEPQSEGTRRTLTTMDRQIDHMVRLIDDLLDVSRINGGRLELRKERIDLTTVIERATEICAPLVLSRQQVVNVEAKESVIATVDATRIAQIVANLLNNASKHSDHGAAIAVRLLREQEDAVIEVIDQGAGIPAAQLERVFDMFTKIERSIQWNGDGLGIGLALSRRLALLHGGTLTAGSGGEFKGAKFTLRIPVGTSTDAVITEQPRTVSGTTKAAAAADRGGLDVAIIEDNEDAAEMMELWLSGLGHHVQIAHNGTEGLALIKESRPDVVLCDIGLPGMDGVEVCRRTIHEVPRPPIMVALTGWGMDADRKRTTDAGFNHHLVKPVDPGKLRALLDSVLDQRSAKQPPSVA